MKKKNYTIEIEGEIEAFAPILWWKRTPLYEKVKRQVEYKQATTMINGYRKKKSYANKMV